MWWLAWGRAVGPGMASKGETGLCSAPWTLPCTLAVCGASKGDGIGTGALPSASFADAAGASVEAAAAIPHVLSVHETHLTSWGTLKFEWDRLFSSAADFNKC